MPQQLTKHSTVKIHHIHTDTPYSHDITLCNFYLVSQMKNWLKSCHVSDAVEVQVFLIALQEFVHGGFQKCSEQQ
jgi:hypothetical protein